MLGAPRASWARNLVSIGALHVSWDGPGVFLGALRASWALNLFPSGHIVSLGADLWRFPGHLMA